MKREFSAGGVVFKQSLALRAKKSSKSIKWFVIKPKGTDRFQLPKGRIEKEESSEDAAKREVEEEGGIKVKVLEKIGEQKYFYYWSGEKIFKIVIFYLMQYQKDKKKGFDTNEIESVHFFKFKEALEKLTFKNDKEMLKKARELLESSVTH